MNWRQLKDRLRNFEAAFYNATANAMAPVNRVIGRLLRRRVKRGSVLHISGMVHVAFHTVRVLRESGVDADYLAIGASPWWNESDYVFRPTRLPVLSVLKEMWWVWSLVSRYEIVHSHFMAGVARSGWEWSMLRAMGRQIVVHYRGCEVRDRALNMRLHPVVNICQECDYRPYICMVSASRRAIAAANGSAFLVTTPDLKDFAPNATHVPFFVTREQATQAAPRMTARPFKIVHATNHPGIEGTRHIKQAIESLEARGYAIDFFDLRGVTHDRVMAELADADVSIGKMKMGYYANFQVESLAAGVPAITHVRDEFVTPQIRDSGLILATLDTLETMIERLITHPDELDAKRRIARESVSRLHDNTAIAGEYVALYDRLRAVAR